MAYNFLGDSPFTIYKPAEKTKVEIFTPLGDSYDISSWADRIDETSKGYIPVVKNQIGELDTSEEPETNTNVEMIINNNPEREILNIQEEIPYNETTTLQSKSYKINPNVTDNKKRALSFFQNRIYNIHKSKGLDDEKASQLALVQSAGIVGNLMQESSLNHSIVNKSSGAYGLAQWLGNRKKALFKKYGNNPTFDQQLEFIWEELNTTERNAFLHLLTTKSYEDSTRSIMDKFERPSKKEKDESIARRLKNAKSLLS